MAQGNNPWHHHLGIRIPNRDAKSPLEVPTTALLLNRFCHTTANVHCGMMYGKMKIELKYFLNFRFVRVTKNAKHPPYKMEIKQVNTASNNVFKSGIHRLVFACALVNKST